MSTALYIEALALKVSQTLPLILTEIETEDGLDSGYIKRLKRFDTYEAMPQSWPNGYAILVNDGFLDETVRYPKTVDTLALIFRFSGDSPADSRKFLYYYRDAVYRMIYDYSGTRVNLGLSEYNVIDVKIKDVALRENLEANARAMYALGVELEIERQG